MLGYDCCFPIDRTGRGGGLALFWCNSLNCNLVDFSSNHVTVEINLVLGDLPAIMAIITEVVELPLGIFFDNFLINLQVLGVSLVTLTICLMRVRKGGAPLALCG